MRKKNTVLLGLVLTLTLITNVAYSIPVTVNYGLTLEYVEPAGSGLEDYFGTTANASITYETETTGVIYSPSFPFITIYENAITNYSVTSYNSVSGFNFSVTGTNSDIQIQDNAGSWDRFLSQYEYNGSTNIPSYSTATEVGVSIDQLYSVDTFDSMSLPINYPLTLDGPLNTIRIILSPGGEGATYGITSVSSVSAASVPEPSTVALLGIGLVGLGGSYLRRRRKQKKIDC